jgi:FAD/FMN-containing dehydrogenase
VEVVLADGCVLDMLRTLRKDNTGYDLKQLFIGAEGTLGVVTAVALKLFPKPAEKVTALVAVRDPAAAIALLSQLQSATGGAMSAFELMPRIGLDFVLAHIPGTSDPLAKPSPWYVLAEASGGANSHLEDAMEAALSSSNLVTDAVIAKSETQRAALWKLREAMSEAQKPEGGSIKHDVSVPIKDIPAFLTEGIAAVEKLVPGIRPVPFGHLGDGNIHFNFSVPKGGDNAAFLKEGIAAVAKLVPGVRPVPFGHLGDGNIHFNFSVPKGGDNAGFLERWNEVQDAVHDIVHRFGGSISAEHGLGIMKVHEIERYKSATELDVMRSLKRTLDPNNILNPGKVVAV